MAKAPAFQFYTGDWMKDPELRSVSLEARGLWVDLLCLMWESPQRGYMVARSLLAFRYDQIARMVGASPETVQRLIEELEAVGVCSRDDRGAIYCRRMVRDAQISAKRAENGRKGGSAKAQNAKDLLGKNSSKTLANDLAKASPSSSSSSSTSVVRDNACARPPVSNPISQAVNSALPPPQLEEVLAECSRIGAPQWIGEDFFQLWEGRGWLDREFPVRNWKALLVTKKNYWESDGRPMKRPGKASPNESNQAKPRNGKEWTVADVL